MALETPDSAIFESILTYAGDSELEPVVDFEDRLESQLAFGLRQDSELKSMFDHALFKVVQTGLLRELMHKWLEDKRPGDMSSRIFTEEAKPLGYENMFFPCLVMASGLAVALVLVLAEKLLLARARARVTSFPQQSASRRL